MKYRITLDTLNDAKEFATIASKIPSKVYLISEAGFRVNGKSILGVIASLAFNDLWVESEINIFGHIQKFIKNGSSNSENTTPAVEHWPGVNLAWTLR